MPKIDRMLVGDRVGHVLAERVMDVGQPEGSRQPAFQPVHDDPNVEKMEVLGPQQFELPPGSVQARDAQLGHQQDQVGAREQ